MPEKICDLDSNCEENGENPKVIVLSESCPYGYGFRITQ